MCVVHAAMCVCCDVDDVAHTSAINVRACSVCGTRTAVGRSAERGRSADLCAYICNLHYLCVSEILYSLRCIIQSNVILMYVRVSVCMCALHAFDKSAP